MATYPSPYSYLTTEGVRTDEEIAAAVEASATLDLDAGASIGGSGIVSDADLAAVALDDLTDVSVASPSDQDVLTWDDGTSTWVAQAGGGGYDGDVSTSIELTRTTATSTGANSIAIGNNARAAGSGGVAIGIDSSAAGGDQISIGNEAGALGSNSDGFRAISIGDGTRPTLGVAGALNGRYSIGIGVFSQPRERAYLATTIGYEALALGPQEISIGFRAMAGRSGATHLRSEDGARFGRNATVNSYRFRSMYHVLEMRASTNATATSKEATATGAESPANTVTVIATDTYDRNVVVLADGKVVGFHLRMTAIQDTTNDAASYEITGAAKCISGTASIIGVNTTTAYEDDASWDCTVTCASNRLVVTCTADAGGTTTWRGTLTLTYEG